MTDIPIANKMIDTNLITSLSKKQKENIELKEAAEQFESLFVSIRPFQIFVISF